MAKPTDTDSAIAFDLRYTIYTKELKNFIDSLLDMYGALWELMQGDDAATEQIYKGIYTELLELIQLYEQVEIDNEYKSDFLGINTDG